MEYKAQQRGWHKPGQLESQWGGGVGWRGVRTEETRPHSALSASRKRQGFVLRRTESKTKNALTQSALWRSRTGAGHLFEGTAEAQTVEGCG